ncbi:DUF4974 domain-containing protein [Chitinophaga agrisoli]|uniref:DUF4974 domain-containing protein n=1 Tax=Chitinophaga agrisoli TaxID=2607653 RepID=A0A5B2VIN8_9BACT|nr:FecR domain-containing protein [Chitinophaga agrisoli]KAA2238785.1 DUF4974 domain-containing protein [Chitinophaga agrisoli]
MMKRDPRHIHALMTSWLTGDISEEEALYLKQLIAEDPAVRETWKELQSRFSPEDVQQSFSRYENLPWIPAEEITSHPQHQPKRKPVIRMLRHAGWAAAIVAGVIGSAALLYYQNTHTVAPVPPPMADRSTVQPENKKIIALQLANGKTINLSQDQQDLQTDEARLNSTSKSMAYTLAGNPAGATALNKLKVPIGKDYKITLSDGTEVWLNSATSLQFPFRFTGATREITIAGEAFLKVAPKADQPFLVHTPYGTVQVLGTSFNVNAYDPGTVEVALVDGAVRLDAGNNKVQLQPGRSATYTLNKGITVQTFDPEEVLSWREGKYYFSDASLEQITNILPRWYGLEVVIDNPNLAGERFAGMMDRHKPVAVFLDNLAKTRKISYYFDSHDVLHLQ